MAILDLYSKRQRRLRGEFPDVYTYDNLPEALRVQIFNLIRSVLGFCTSAENNGRVAEAANRITAVLKHEYGVLSLVKGRFSSDYRAGELMEFFFSCEDVERCLDVVEMCFQAIDQSTRYYGYMGREDYDERADAAIEELNARFKEHGVGYQFASNEIIRVDSQFVHTEAVIPALRVLQGADYAGAQEEFLNAFAHYRHGNKKEALNDCLKAFESTMKAICKKRGWTFDPNDTAKSLIDTLYRNNIIPAFWQGQIGSLRSLLESGIPTGRNKLGGHGQGAVPVDVPDYLVSYMLHMTASTIVFLANAEQAIA